MHLRVGHWTGVARDGDFMNPANWNGLGGTTPAQHDLLVINAGGCDIKGGDTKLTDISLWIDAPSFGGTIGKDRPLLFGGSVTMGDPSRRQTYDTDKPNPLAGMAHEGIVRLAYPPKPVGAAELAEVA